MGSLSERLPVLRMVFLLENIYFPIHPLFICSYVSLVMTVFSHKDHGVGLLWTLICLNVIRMAFLVEIQTNFKV